MLRAGGTYSGLRPISWHRLKRGAQKQILAHAPIGDVIVRWHLLAQAGFPKDTH